MSDLLASDLITPDAGENPLLSQPSVSILKAAPLTRLSLRLRNQSVKDAGDAFGAALPVTPLGSSVSDKRAALWMGPDEWTLLAPEEELSAVFDAIEAKLSGQPHSLVDVSDRSEAIIVSGEKAEWLLRTGIFIDFSLDAFPVGTVTRTIFHKAPVLVWRTGDDTFVIEAWVSFMDYVSGLLMQSAQELEAA
ncbi:sarcosine oxidase subunit gamma [Roseibium denhamense]|uniref:Sarcosine oxidase subunit gamma n=1 Tax=Roseibium denhamense TaxID=76305 RepID=A0ABY1NUA2_9HYPH|nr:sarcosine oxidase subunit gamma family protein [Roseibium denhamense]MTI08068.1 sarcosine oxidase subunit gamma [Roseibium denhamense]SMP16095.1 sarcosine oxidase subunit gamma [Roseibium denhamense]